MSEKEFRFQGPSYDFNNDILKLKSELKTANAEIKVLREMLSERTEKYSIAMDKGVDVYKYKLKKAIGALKYAYEDHSDQFYLNVIEELEK